MLNRERSGWARRRRRRAVDRRLRRRCLVRVILNRGRTRWARRCRGRAVVRRVRLGDGHLVGATAALLPLGAGPVVLGDRSGPVAGAGDESRGVSTVKDREAVVDSNPEEIVRGVAHRGRLRAGVRVVGDHTVGAGRRAAVTGVVRRRVRAVVGPRNVVVLTVDPDVRDKEQAAARTSDIGCLSTPAIAVSPPGVGGVVCGSQRHGKHPDGQGDRKRGPGDYPDLSPGHSQCPGHGSPVRFVSMVPHRSSPLCGGFGRCRLNSSKTNVTRRN
jgi:hypothetical protein